MSKQPQVLPQNESMYRHVRRSRGAQEMPTCRARGLRVPARHGAERRDVCQGQQVRMYRPGRQLSQGEGGGGRDITHYI